jgi:hypothetical protein
MFAVLQSALTSAIAAAIAGFGCMPEVVVSATLSASPLQFEYAAPIEFPPEAAYYRDSAV